MDILLLSNCQNDFYPGGTVGVNNAPSIIKNIKTISTNYDLIIASIDAHHPTHLAFAANHPWRRPGTSMEIDGIEYQLQAMHGVEGSFGASLFTEMESIQIAKTFKKGTNPQYDDYSAFYDQNQVIDTGLHAYLQQQAIVNLHIAGFLLEKNIFNTAIDAQRLGYQIKVLENATGSHLEKSAQKEIYRKLQAKNIDLI